MRWTALLLCLAAATAAAQTPAPGDLVINEVMYDPPSPQPSSTEWVEILNTTTGPLDLGGLAVADASATSDPVPDGTTLAAGAYAVLVRDGAGFAAAYPGVAFIELGGFPALNNSGDRAALVLGSAEVDAVPYTPSWGGADASLERRDPNGPSTSAANFGTTTDPAGGTPGAQNTLFAPDVTGPVLVDATASEDGRTVTVTTDEPVDAASVTASAFSVSDGPTVTAASYDDAALAVTLTLSAPLAPGTSTVTATNLRDAIGNTTASSSTTVLYDPDLTPPTLLAAEAQDAQSMLVTFDEALDPISAETEANYVLDPGVGSPAEATLQGDGASVLLTLAAPLTGPAAYTLTASGVADAAGNTSGSQSADFFFGEGATPAPFDLVVNEFLYDEPATGNPGEFVELFNRSDQTFDLREFSLNDNTGPDEPITTDPVFVGPGEYAVIVEDAALFAAVFPDVPFVEQPAWSALNNTGDAIVLRFQGSLIDSLTYSPSWGGADASLERKDPDGPSSAASNHATTTDPRGGTPGALNSQFAPDVTGPMLVAAVVSEDGQRVTVAVDEPLDPTSVTLSAFAVTGGPAVTDALYDDAELSVTLSLSAPLAPGTSTVTASGLRDLLGNTTASTSTTVDYDPDLTPPTLLTAEAVDEQTVRVTFDEALDPASAQTPSNYAIDGGIGAPMLADLQDGGTTVILALSAPLTAQSGYALTVQDVADAAGNAIATQTATFFFGEGDAAEPRDLVVNEFLYDEPSADNPGEFVEVFNRSDKTFDLREFTLNDGTGEGEPVTDQAVFVGPGEYTVIVEDAALFAAVFPGVPFVEQPTWSALNNSGDAVVLTYEDTVVDSLFYTPDWGGEDASLERKDPEAPSVAANFATTADLRGGTPGTRNSRFEPDVTGPTLVAALASADGRRLLVTLDEPAQPASVTASAFSVGGGPAIATAVYTPGAATVLLGVADGQALAVGTSTVTATGLTDLVGNTTASTSVEVTRAEDTTAPSITRAAPQAATVVRVQFSEPVTAETGAAPSTYALTAEGAAPGVAAVAIVDTDDVSGQTGSPGVLSVDLTLDAPLPDRVLTTLTATGLRDLAGNVAGPLTARLFFGTADTPEAGQVVITEVMYDPATGSAGEYIELLNTTADRLFDLRAITLGDAADPGDALADDAAVILPGEYLAVVRDAEGFRLAFPEAAFVEGGSGISLSNAGKTLALWTDGTVIESVTYDPDWHRVELDDATGLSLERRDPARAPNEASNWSSSLAEAGGTPSAPNSVAISGTPVEREAGLVITSPFAPTRGEASQITYTLSTEAALVRARIYDGGGRAVREIEAGRLSGTTATVTWDGTDDDRRPVRAGIYVVLVEAVDAQGGTSEGLRGVVVLARPE